MAEVWGSYAAWGSTSACRNWSALNRTPAEDAALALRAGFRGQRVPGGSVGLQRNGIGPTRTGQGARMRVARAAGAAADGNGGYGEMKLGAGVAPCSHALSFVAGMVMHPISPHLSKPPVSLETKARAPAADSRTTGSCGQDRDRGLTPHAHPRPVPEFAGPAIALALFNGSTAGSAGLLRPTDCSRYPPLAPWRFGGADCVHDMLRSAGDGPLSGFGLFTTATIRHCHPSSPTSV
ncbi:hypothetical protein K458DRAFT_403430 [Lentithecium fluviatile CBS 122367]|uniref:Uncharacterized protein n=1 Tax=Lentithecium fluviatile CBS 122367 TaxID=1168545 RepID=A0A6G1J4P3_9PLEO|nr:hypothetical protein K458DRAFT_403430 [Lentithecium fluviatile CBS 122367]